MYQVYLGLEAFSFSRYSVFVGCFPVTKVPSEPVSWKTWELFTNIFLWGKDRELPTGVYRHLVAKRKESCTKST